PVIDRGDVALDLAGDEVHPGDLLAHRVHVAPVERPDLPAVGLDREDEEDVRSERTDLLFDVGGDPAAESDHGDDGGDADDDAERGQEAPENMAPDLPEGEQERGAEHAEHHATPAGAPWPWPRSTLSTSPSLKWTMVRANSAMSGSWVTIRMVMPVRLSSPRNS